MHLPAPQPSGQEGNRLQGAEEDRRSYACRGQGLGSRGQHSPLGTESGVSPEESPWAGVAVGKRKEEGVVFGE